MPTHPRNSTRSKKKKHKENYTKTCRNQIAQNQGRDTKWIQNKTGNEEKKIKELEFGSLKRLNRGTWVAQSVKRLTSVQVMISQFVSLSPTLGVAFT